MFPDINKALRKFQHILEYDNQWKQLFPRGTFRVAYKRGHKNLKELIAPSRVNTGMSVGSNYDRDTQGKCVKCGSCGASNRGRKRKSGIYACQVVKEGSSFKSNQTGETYKIRQDINCRSENNNLFGHVQKMRNAGSSFMYNLLQTHLKLYHQYRK